MKNINPPGIWEETGTKFGHRFINHSITALYGYVTYRVRDGNNFPWYWEARVLLSARDEVNSPTCGYAPTLESGKKIVETLLRETNTVEFAE
jgi:hypothetical protein